MQVIGNAMRPMTPCPQLVPLADGGVQIEWHQKGIDIELAIHSPYVSDLWFSVDGLVSSQQLSADFAPFERVVDELSRR
jgi:hypothetical protein